MPRNFVIAFEGMDGTGKTKFSQLFSGELKKIGIPNTCWPIDSLGEITRKQELDPDLSFEYYISSLALRLESKSTDVMVFDRYAPSALGYLWLRKSRVIDSRINRELDLIYTKIIRPDMVFVLESSESMRMSRILQKKLADRYDLLSLDQRVVGFWKSFYNKVSDNSFTYLDTNRNETLVLQDIKAKFLMCRYSLN